MAFAKNCSKALKFRTGLAYSNHAAQWTSEGIPTAAEAESPFDPGFTWGTVTSYPNLTPRGGSGVCQTSQPLLRHLPLHLPRLLLVSTFPHQSLTFLITRGAGAGMSEGKLWLGRCFIKSMDHARASGLWGPL